MAMLRRLCWLILLSVPLAAAESTPPRLKAVTMRAQRFDVSAPLRSTVVPPKARGDRPGREREIPIRRLPRGRNGEILEATANQDFVRSSSNAVAPATPAPAESFEGISSEDNFDVYGGRAVPPDTNGVVPTTTRRRSTCCGRSANRHAPAGPIRMTEWFAGSEGATSTTMRI